jgi:Heterokaryon incompatibility protein (HET)
VRPFEAYITMAPYPYKPLSHELREIRLLQVQQSRRKTAPVCCSLNTVSLIDNPNYFALSYVWGEPDFDEHIFIDGTAAAVTKALLEPLRSIREVLGTILLRVDALCINQQDTNEKNQQVQLMKDIYANAATVISWLGRKQRHFDVAFDMLQRILDASSKYGPDEFDAALKLEAQKPDSRRVFFSGTAKERMRILSWDARCWLIGKRAIIADAWALISQIFIHTRYWTRVWIFQECVLASNLIVMAGNRTIDMNAITLWMSFLERRLAENHSRAYIFDNEIDTEYIRLILEIRAGTVGSNRSFISLIEKTACLRATDPRDHIFALAAISIDNIVPNYHESTEKTYSKFARRWIQVTHDLSILPSVEISRRCGYEKNSLPSWVPDWGIISHDELHTLPKLRKRLGYYSAAGEISPQVQALPDGTLCAFGIEFDAVQRLWSPPKGFAGFNGVEDAWKTCLHDYYQTSPDRKSPYVTGISKTHAFLRLLLNDIDPIHGERIDPWTKPEHYAELVIQTCVLFDILEATDFDGPCAIRGNEKRLFDATKVQDKIEVLRGIAAPESRQAQRARRMEHLDWIVQFETWVKGRSFFVSEKGYIGIADRETELGDVIGVLFGCNMPVIVRRNGLHYTFHGFCFVLGLMDGEALVAAKDGGAKEVKFIIN